MKLKSLAIMLAVILLTPAIAFGMASFDFPVVSPVVTFVAGDVTIKGTGETGWDPAELGQLLSSGDAIRTGPASKAEISFATGKIRLYENTVIIVPEVVDEGDKEDIRGVTLDDGAGLFRIKKRGVEKGFEVKTSNIIAGVKGTLFAVVHRKAEDYSRVAVYSGIVEVTDIRRNPDTLTPLKKGTVMDVLEDLGFGDMDHFEPGNVWKEWEKLTNPGTELLGRTAPAATTSLRVNFVQLQPGEGDEYEYEFDCPPVIDNNGNTIIP